MNNRKSKGIIHVAETTKAIVPLHDCSGVVAWMGDHRFCIYNDIGMELGCWTLDALILGGLVEGDTTVTTKKEAIYVLQCIVKRLYEISKRYSSKVQKNNQSEN